MNRHICGLLLALSGILTAQDDLRPILETSYGQWRNAIITKDAPTWKKVTALHRQVEVKNRILSEKKAFPSAVFDLPGKPPAIDNLKHLSTIRNGPTANSFYYGKIDFGVGEITQSNLLLISYVGSGQGWKYDKMNFISLISMDDVRRELEAGDLSYLKNTPELQPSGQIPITPTEIKEPQFIAKIYVFCPGREVIAQINGISRHQFGNTKEAELIIGGARSGKNLVQFSTKSLEGSTGNEALAIRVYLMSQVKGVKPVKIYEYLVKENEAVEAYGRGAFEVDARTAAQLNGRTR